MKQAMNTTKMIAMGLFTLCTMGLSASGFAASNATDPTELKLIGKIKNQPVFQLSLNNGESGEYFIIVKDEDQNELYSEKIKGINLSRKYQLAIDESDIIATGFEINVEVTSSKTHITQVYKIRSHSSILQNIEVANL